ncbi:hypothetical protein [Lysinibacillus xylanilyticus]|uniref:hypothetical protein n=1 Tax=Lysinibacillus xylanilyticus TaxID=582475 RepID=UPI003D0580D4
MQLKYDFVDLPLNEIRVGATGRTLLDYCLNRSLIFALAMNEVFGYDIIAVWRPIIQDNKVLQMKLLKVYLETPYLGKRFLFDPSGNTQTSEVIKYEGAITELIPPQQFRSQMKDLAKKYSEGDFDETNFDNSFVQELEEIKQFILENPIRYVPIFSYIENALTESGWEQVERNLYHPDKEEPFHRAVTGCRFSATRSVGQFQHIIVIDVLKDGGVIYHIETDDNHRIFQTGVCSMEQFILVLKECVDIKYPIRSQVMISALKITGEVIYTTITNNYKPLYLVDFLGGKHWLENDDLMAISTN